MLIERWLTRLLLIAKNAFERERWIAHKTLGLLFTAQRALKRGKYGFKRLLTSCSQLRERSKEKIPSEMEVAPHYKLLTLFS